jgi:hypothetical protein
VRRSTEVLFLVLLLYMIGEPALGQPGRVHRNGLTICSVIITELTEGRLGVEKAREISEAIAAAGNKHFGRVTCGEMWLFMAIAHVESGFKNNIINHQACIGMFQVHGPSWAGKMGLRYRDLLNVEINAEAGIGVFKYYLERHKSLLRALSAYNSDHPTAAVGYAAAVLGARKRIKRRYAELYRAFGTETDPQFVLTGANALPDDGDSQPASGFTPAAAGGGAVPGPETLTGKGRSLFERTERGP